MDDGNMAVTQSRAPLTDDGDSVDANPEPSGPAGSDSVDVRGELGATGGPAAARGQGAGVVMTGRQFDADCYNMNHKRRGKAIIFNNKDFDKSTGMGTRTGTDLDSENMSKVLREMGFEVEVFRDFHAADMESALVKEAREDHTDADCFACVILTHGEEGYVYGKDRPIEIDRLVAPFKGHKCKTLAGKPKIFFIQACRGSQTDEGTEVMDSVGGDEIRRIPTEADFLMAHSVVPGYYAWRNSLAGSWFIQALVLILQENWRRMDLLTMMTRVCKKVAYDFESNTSRESMNHKKQMPCITSMLTRDLYFTPKK